MSSVAASSIHSPSDMEPSMTSRSMYAFGKAASLGMRILSGSVRWSAAPEPTAGQQREHPFPDGPVVAETSLQGYVFLNERIEGTTERLASPADFGDPTGGPNDLECRLHRGRDASGIDDAVDAERVAGLRPFGDSFDQGRAAVAAGDFE